MIKMNTPQSTCAISVVIPMYNAEKFIGACLSSISSQTFQNFEVIIADDCSTDNSVAVAKNYLEKFDGRLKIFHMKKIRVVPVSRPTKVLLMLAGNIF